MISECRKGNIDLIVTKSISRFARNTVTLLNTVRELKAMDVEVFFEEQNIYSRNFEAGKPWCMNVLGYRLVDGVLQVKPDEAATVRRIFQEYLDGKGVFAIMKGLIDDGIPVRRNGQWRTETIQGILTNYVYTGNLLLQKTFRRDYISKAKVINRGELPMYQVQGTHEPIISLEMYEAVQAEKKRRAGQHIYVPPKNNSLFTGYLRCPYCGANYHRKKGYRVFQWRCSTYLLRGKAFCTESKTIPEDMLMRETMDVLGCAELNSKILADRIEFIEAKAGNVLAYHFLGGGVEERIWQDRSRRES